MQEGETILHKNHNIWHTYDLCASAADSLDTWVGHTFHKTASVAPVCGCRKKLASVRRTLEFLTNKEIKFKTTTNIFFVF